MGYDMSIKGELPAAPEHEVYAARAAYDAAAAAHQARLDEHKREQEAKGESVDHDFIRESYAEADALGDALQALTSPDYFRLNIWGMSRYADAMIGLGMVHFSRSPVAQEDWPEYPEDEDADALERYQEESDRVTARHGDAEDPTIPLHKFGSNDGWLVTPEEIRAALEIWDRVTDERKAELSDDAREIITSDYWAKWIDYLRLAADHEGFRVY